MILFLVIAFWTYVCLIASMYCRPTGPPRPVRTIEKAALHLRLGSELLDLAISEDPAAALAFMSGYYAMQIYVKPSEKPAPTLEVDAAGNLIERGDPS